MPIAIDAGTGVATISGGTGIITETIDGVMVPWGTQYDGITKAEAVKGQAAVFLTGVALGSNQARKRQAAGEKPILGIFL